MKKYSFLLLLAAFTGVLFFSACTKEADKPEEENPAPTVTSKFTWSQSSTNYTADYSEFVPDFNNIYASKIDGSSIDIFLDNLNKGAHTIVPTAGRTFVYTDSNGIKHEATSGSVTISENTGTTLSGSYSCTLDIGTISGSFSNIPKK
ncbi:MAG: hypothetical protein JNL60_18800 [Bacteroidia bacterium]|nr:hypothetical protein [Bacteroidia bacterium]